MPLIKTKKKILLREKGYNFTFDMNTGFFARWGETYEDDPDYSPYGPEIADIEIATACSGVGKVCDFCYKKNTPRGEYMSLETFKKLHSKLPPTVTQIAFGIGDIDSNPDLWDIFQYCHDQKIVPNITVNGLGITDEVADKLAHYCGAVAVSYYVQDVTFDAIKKLTDRGMKQINIHFMIAEETYEKALELLKLRYEDERIENMNAIVFLSLKKKGRAERRYTQLSQDKFDDLVQNALENNVPIGFDSCSAMKFMKAVNDDPKYAQYIEPCESTRFSLYINVKGEFYPCSFLEKIDVENGGQWSEGINVLEADNFVKDVWNNEKTKMFRNKCINCVHGKISCSHYEI